MKRQIIAILFSLILGTGGCGAPSSGNVDSDSPAAQSFKRGGLYATKHENGQYSISKVLEVDDFAVHLRFYNEEFPTIPKAVDSKELTYLIGHAPVAVDGFLAEQPTLISVENVSEEELEGYKVYLEEMGDR